MTRDCPHCGKPITGHPNKKFCGPRCKDKHHNARNPRGHAVINDFVDYANTIHPFSSEAFEE
jgi:predicted nucleic acid-binding Zn ribbon protein